MASEESIWFRVGYALERARRAQGARKTLTSLADRDAETTDGEPRRPTLAWPSADELVSSGVAALISGLLDARRPSNGTRLGRLLRAGAAGAGAALLLDVLRPLLSGTPSLPTVDRDTGDRVLVGIGQGLVYGAVVEPRVPGPPLLKGALFGSAEYATDLAGGLSHLLGAHAPQGRVPVLGDFLESLDSHDRRYLEHVVFGIALALLYGSSPSSNGILVDGEEE